MIMNYQLMSAGLLPINIRTENRIRYYDALDKCVVERDLQPFAELVAEVEEAKIRHYLSIEFEPSEDVSEQGFKQKM